MNQKRLALNDVHYAREMLFFIECWERKNRVMEQA